MARGIEWRHLSKNIIIAVDGFSSPPLHGLQLPTGSRNRNANLNRCNNWLQQVSGGSSMPGRKIQGNASADSTKEAPGRDVILRTDHFVKNLGRLPNLNTPRVSFESQISILSFFPLFSTLTLFHSRSLDNFVYTFQLYTS